MEFLIRAQHTGDKMLTVADETNYCNLVFSSTINLLACSSGGQKSQIICRLHSPQETLGVNSSP